LTVITAKTDHFSDFDGYSRQRYIVFLILNSVKLEAGVRFPAKE